MLNAEMILALVALLGCLGGGLRFVIVRTDRKQAEIEQKQREEQTRLEAERVRHELKVDTERLRWEQLMADQILELRREIRLQEHEVAHLRDTSSAYLRHISAL